MFYYTKIFFLGGRGGWVVCGAVLKYYDCPLMTVKISNLLFLNLSRKMSILKYWKSLSDEKEKSDFMVTKHITVGKTQTTFGINILQLVGHRRHLEFHNFCYKPVFMTKISMIFLFVLLKIDYS